MLLKKYNCIKFILFFFAINISSIFCQESEVFLFGIDRITLKVDDEILHDSIFYGYHVYDAVSNPDCNDDLFFEHDTKVINLDKLDVKKSSHTDVLKQLLLVVNIHKYLNNSTINLNNYFYNILNYEFNGSESIYADLFKYNEIDLEFKHVKIENEYIDISNESISIDDSLTRNFYLNNLNGNSIKTKILNGSW